MNILRKHFFDFPIRVLIYREGSVIVARALEFDLLGYGKNENDAMQQLLESVKAQVSFCSSVNNPEMALFPAPKEYLERWETAHMTSTPTGEKALILVFDKSGETLSPQCKFSQVSSLEKRIDAIDLTKRPKRQASPTPLRFSKSET
jgi:hypothetical protein